MALDPHDTNTATLPGVPTKPERPKRTNEDQRKKFCGYQMASQRASCARCINVDQRLHNTGSAFESQTLYCKQHRFNVGKHAICTDYQAPPARATAAKRINLVAADAATEARAQ